MSVCKCFQPFTMQGIYFSLCASTQIKISPFHLSLLQRPYILTWANTTAFVKAWKTVKAECRVKMVFELCWGASCFAETEKQWKPNAESKSFLSYAELMEQRAQSQVYLNYVESWQKSMIINAHPVLRKPKKHTLPFATLWQICSSCI